VIKNIQSFKEKSWMDVTKEELTQMEENAGKYSD